MIAFTALSLGLIYLGSCNEEVAQAIIFALMDRSETELGDALGRLLPLSLGLLYLGKQVRQHSAVNTFSVVIMIVFLFLRFDLSLRL